MVLAWLVSVAATVLGTHQNFVLDSPRPNLRLSEMVLAGTGTHSSNKQSHLKPIVLAVLREYKLSFPEAGLNTGAMIVEVQH